MVVDEVCEGAHEARDGARVPALGVDERAGDEGVVRPIDEGVAVKEEKAFVVCHRSGEFQI